MKHWSIYLTLALSTFFWGANFNLGHYVVQLTDPLSAAGWRFIIASVIMATYMLVKEGVDWAGIRNNLLPLAGMALLGIFGFNVAFFYGMQTSSAINGSLIMTLNPTITVILTALVIGDAISWRQVLGLALSMMGVVTVVTGGSWVSLAHLAFARGDALILLGNLCWAAYSVIGKRFVKNLSSLQATTTTMLMGTAAIIALGTTVHSTGMSVPPAMSLSAIAIMAIFGTVLAYLWWNNGIRAIGPARTAVFFDLVPIFTMLIAIALGERVGLAQWAGAALVITGVLFSSGALDTFLKPPSVEPARS